MNNSQSRGTRSGGKPGVLYQLAVEIRVGRRVQRTNEKVGTVMMRLILYFKKKDDESWASCASGRPRWAGEQRDGSTMTNPWP